MKVYPSLALTLSPLSLSPLSLPPRSFALSPSLSPYYIGPLLYRVTIIYGPMI